MKYSYKFKLEYAEYYIQTGNYLPVPKNVNSDTFKHLVRDWAKLLKIHGEEVLKHNKKNKYWSADEKFKIIMQFKSGKTLRYVASKAGINPGLLYSWVRKYDELGYNGLIHSKKGKPPKKTNMKKNVDTSPKDLTKSEREELIRLREEIEYIKAENEVLKKEQALRHKKWDEQLKAKKQQSSKNSEKKDTN